MIKISESRITGLLGKFENMLNAYFKEQIFSQYFITANWSEGFDVADTLYWRINNNTGSIHFKVKCLQTKIYKIGVKHKHSLGGAVGGLLSVGAYNLRDEPFSNNKMENEAISLDKTSWTFEEVGLAFSVVRSQIVAGSLNINVGVAVNLDIAEILLVPQ